MSKKRRSKKFKQQQPLNNNPVGPVIPRSVPPQQPDRIVAMSYSGPLPHPDDLERYGEIVTGGAERILVLLEQQTAHRIEMEKIVVTTDAKRQSRGMIFGFIVALVGLGGSIFLGYKGAQVAAGILGGGTLASLVYTFVIGIRAKETNVKKNK